MGGLFARAYVLDQGRAAKVDKVISVGTPYWGAPLFAKYMRAGTLPYINMQVPYISDLIKQLIRNSPGSMQILPSESFFVQQDPYFKDNELI